MMIGDDDDDDDNDDDDDDGIPRRLALCDGSLYFFVQTTTHLA